MKKEGFLIIRQKLLILLFLILVSLFMAFGCSDPSDGRGPYSLDDEKLLPFAAMYEIDRESFCLTEIDRNSRVEIERDYGGSHGYNVMLHIYSDGVSRTVAFVWENGRYVWIGEQELHYSGRRFITVDGEVREHIAVSYYKREIDGGTIGLSISYSGGYENLPSSLTCEQASPYIREWDARKEAPDSK